MGIAKAEFHRSDVAKLPLKSDSFDAADDWIVEQSPPQDIVVTSDIPLAARALAKGARALDPKGKPFLPDSIGDALASREISAFLSQGRARNEPGPS